MKIFKFYIMCIVLLSVLFINACDGLSGLQSSNYKYFNYDLRGTWVSNEQSGVYTGSLKIDSETITIDGYGENWTTWLDDDNQRPFKDFPKRVPLKGYSEEGKIFIEYGGTVQSGIPYIYTETGTYPDKYKLLEFTFDGRKEILQLTTDS